ncbi:hypothetical protein [Vibrio variabilis]|uniref:hypothetical protein n=1 Tax=Vibrio variabilis TaxID=990271 RepID=UPI0013A69A45|nr:hypothetical protein [Vibrio variabilis]
MMVATDWLLVAVGCHLLASIVSLLGNSKREAQLLVITGVLTALAGAVVLLLLCFHY